MSDEYVPGQCNIGKAEIRARSRMGWAAVVVSAVAVTVILVLELAAAWMLVVAVPIYMAAIAHVQARERFCVGFAAARRYSFGDRRGPTGTVENEADIEADVTRAREINGRAARWTLIITLALVLVAALL